MSSLVDLEWEGMKQINSESKVEGMNTYDLIQERTNVNKPMQSEWYLSYEQYTFDYFLYFKKKYIYDILYTLTRSILHSKSISKVAAY